MKSRSLSSSSSSWQFFFSVAPVAAVVEKLGVGVVGDDIPEDNLGVVRASPETLLFSANQDLPSPIDLDTYTLARAIRSEHGRSSRTLKTWIAWAVRNEARRRRTSVHNLSTKSRARTSGLYARQRTDARYIATNVSPRGDDVEVARDVLRAPQSSDVTKGATNFFSPRTQDALFARAQRGDPKLVGRITRDADGVRFTWLSRGLVSRGTPPGVPEDEIEFFGAVA